MLCAVLPVLRPAAYRLQRTRPPKCNVTSHHRCPQVTGNLGSVSACGNPKRVTWDPALTLIQTPTLNQAAGELKPPRVLRAERTALECQLIADIVDGERFGAQVARLCDAFGTAQKKMIAGADQQRTLNSPTLAASLTCRLWGLLQWSHNPP